MCWCLFRRGETYYLNRNYYRGDPTLSALVDWQKMLTVTMFYAYLRSKNISYIMYSDVGWPKALGGQRIPILF